MFEYQYYEFQAIERPLTEAVEMLLKRHGLAVFQCTEEVYEARLQEIRDAYPWRKALLQRLDKAGLPYGRERRAAPAKWLMRLPGVSRSQGRGRSVTMGRCIERIRRNNGNRFGYVGLWR